jgi:sugar-specific transcriptional regulator TrmB
MEDLSHIFGLDEKEKSIFSVLIKIKHASVNVLMKKTQIERRTIYDVLERLIQRGYVRYSLENGVRIYHPTDKEVLLESLSKKVEDFKQIMPQFDSVQGSEDANVELFKGIEGIRMVFNEIVALKETHYAFGDVSKFVEKAGFDTQKFLARLERAGAKEKIIYPVGKKILRIQKGEYRVLSKDLVPPTPVIICGDVTFLFMFSDPVLVIRIDNKEMTSSYKKYFDTYWKTAKRK